MLGEIRHFTQYFPLLSDVGEIGCFNVLFIFMKNYNDVIKFYAILYVLFTKRKIAIKINSFKYAICESSYIFRNQLFWVRTKYIFKT